MSPLPLAHAGHWIWQLMSAVPIVVVGIAAWLASRRDPGRDERLEKEAEERAERELDEILSP